jgi:flagellar protein FliS
MNTYAKAGYAPNTGRSAYQSTDVETADRGKLVIMVYDHCIKWCKIAREHIQAGRIQDRTKALFRVQDGITELMCALDFEKGGDVAKNLYRLYDFYNRHLSEANVKNSEKHVQQVQEMLENLRASWIECFEIVRRSGTVNMRTSQNSFVSVRG